ncbi:MAG: hypothetical protein OQK93_01700, partial [Gammaproteobacteria bacterium]|nr:hypothetical protein [Gammaproteobacteria bacterium]
MIDNKIFHNTLLLAGITVLTVTLTSCGAGKTSMFRSDSSHSAVYPTDGPTRLDSLDWKYSAPDKTYSSPTVAN